MLKSEKNFLANDPMGPSEAPYPKMPVKNFPQGSVLDSFFGDTRDLLESFGVENPWVEIFSQMNTIIPLL